VGQPWLQSLELVAQPDLIISSPDETLGEIAPLLERLVGVDLETGADVRTLSAAFGLDGTETTAPTTLLVGAQPDLVLAGLRRFSLVGVAASLPAERSSSDQSPPNQRSIITVGLHGFAGTRAAPDTSFSIQMIDDWGIEDVMASAFDLASRQGLPLAVMFDLAVLDPAFDRKRTIPGGLDMRRLLRAARAAGRRTDVIAGGFVKAGSDLNLAYVLMSFCAGLAGR
jgi:hypothetical protein